MEDEEGLSDWIEIDYRMTFEILNSVFGTDNKSVLRAYNKVESVRRLSEVGVHVTFYNRNKTIHNYGK